MLEGRLAFNLVLIGFDRYPHIVSDIENDQSAVNIESEGRSYRMG